MLNIEQAFYTHIKYLMVKAKNFTLGENMHVQKNVIEVIQEKYEIDLDDLNCLYGISIIRYKQTNLFFPFYGHLSLVCGLSLHSTVDLFILAFL